MAFSKICMTVRDDQKEEMEKYSLNWSGQFQKFLDILLPKLAIAMQETKEEFNHEGNNLS